MKNDWRGGVGGCFDLGQE